MNIDYNKILKLVFFLAALCVVVGMLTKIFRTNSESLNEYASANPEIAYAPSAKREAGSESDKKNSAANTPESGIDLRSNLVSAVLNASQPAENYTLYSEGFYYAPLSDALRSYMSGKSYPDLKRASAPLPGIDTQNIISLDDLYFLHIWYFDFENNPTEGAIICNKAIAQDLAEIFCELYRNKYCLESVLPLDEYDGSCRVSAGSNNSFCFGLYDTLTVSSLHSQGRAVCVNPVYNPFVAYNSNGISEVFPDESIRYSDRTKEFSYKIDPSDLCFRLFTEHGFVWCGDRNSDKNYGCFEK